MINAKPGGTDPAVIDFVVRLIDKLQLEALGPLAELHQLIKQEMGRRAGSDDAIGSIQLAR